MANRIEILDSTLRDGAQSEGISFSVQDKINIIKALDEFGVHYIEAGNPGSNPKDIEFFERAKKMELKSAVLCAFGSTHRKNKRVDEDENVLSLLSAGTKAVSIFGKSWDLHVTQILKATLEQNLGLVHNTVKFFKDNGREVIFDAEHFFDGYKANPEYAMKVLKSAADAGADVLCLLRHKRGVPFRRDFQDNKKCSRCFRGHEDRHPLPQRHRLRRGKLYPRGRGRRLPRAGHLYGNWRALRQHRPERAYTKPPAQKGLQLRT
jgi:2-isopropylmalate synthase